MEVRTINGTLAIREAEGQEGNVIEGTAIVFDSESEVLAGSGVRFREVIKPEAVTQAFIDTQDVKLNLLHERNDTIARCNQGKGNMTITVGDGAVTFRAGIPDCDLGNRAREMIRSGVYTGCSFEFIPDDYEVVNRGVEEPLIVHKKIRAIRAFTIAMDPAYSQTSVNVRELIPEPEVREEEKAPAKEEPAKRSEREVLAAQRRQIDRDLYLCELDNLLKF